MYDENNIFAKILRNELPCNEIYQDNFSLFFNDINPQAKIHVLGIPKVKRVDFADFVKNESNEYVVEFFKSIDKVLELLKVKKDGYRIISNSGINGGQEVPHFHIHILAGDKVKSII